MRLKLMKILENERISKIKEALKIKKVYTTVIAIALVITCTSIYFALENDVTITVDNKNQKLHTFSNTVQELLKEQNIELGKNDKVLPDLNSKLKDNMKIEVKRAYEVNLVLNGEKRKIITTQDTVEGILKENKITVSEMDKVTPKLDQKLAENKEIKIVRIEEKIVVQTEDVGYEVETVYDNNLEVGKVEKVQNGSYGKKEATYKVRYSDGKEESRTLVSQNTIQNPTNEIVKKGTKDFIVTSRGETKTFKKSLTASVSAYTAGFESTGKRPGDKGYGKTRMGTTVRPGVIAVDPKVIPLGSKVYIPHLGMTCVAEDTGGAIKGNKIDVYMSSLSKANRFGRKNLKVYVLD
ncbi:3D domain-containing protein [Tepidibacter hydrothermalis]|uniref:Ubiquitin-like domain-containing protein n=1 Tax=Tepidibacter hydrothermalis TaxID=3036126 RepID=A0ABY8EBZ5_9FIRM|nr:3D domain-containing protein [Tepidibacter hydrothermalis]WFD10475.1 ubiquitin-like domain-containing protein [Tepidibacter hydrothermalis]